MIALFLYKWNWKIGHKITFLKYLFLIFLLQMFFYVKREPDFSSFHFSNDHIIPYLFAIFVMPFSEEYIYRGCLVDFFRYIFKHNIIWPVVLSSIVFCAMHTQYTRVLDFTVLFLVSVILSFSRIKSGSLLPPVLLHSSMNAFVILLSNLNVF